MISNSLFRDFVSSGDGGAVYSTDRDFNFSCCEFISNVAANRGGGIFITGGKLIISNVNFIECYSTKNTNDIWGNAIYHEGTVAVLEQLSLRYCGVSSTKCTDSSIALAYSKAFVHNYNASRNYGISGSSMLSMYSSLAGTELKYMQGVECCDSFEIETWNTAIKVDKTNFINTNDRYCLLWENANNLITLDSCILWNLSKTTLSDGNRIIRLVNCTSNQETNPKVTIVTDLYTFPIIIKSCALPKMITCSCNRYRNTFDIFLSIITIIIS
jgi:hypothetical protein